MTSRNRAEEIRSRPPSRPGPARGWRRASRAGTRPRRSARSVAGLRSRIRKRLAGDRQELPRVAAVPKDQPEDTERVLVESLHVGGRPPGLVTAPTGSDDEL